VRERGRVGVWRGKPLCPVRFASWEVYERKGLRIERVKKTYPQTRSGWQRGLPLQDINLPFSPTW